MKKILFAIPGNSSFLKPSMATFKQLGWEVRNVNYRKTDLVAACKNLLKLSRPIVNEITSNGRPSVKRIINNQEILRVAKLWKPDLFLTFKGEIILLETVVALKKIGIKTVNWYPDHLSDTSDNSAIIRAYDHFVYWDSWRTNEYHKQGFQNVIYLPFCTTPEESLAPKNKKYQINFVASWQEHREKKITPVASLGLKIWGNNAWAQSKLSQNYQFGPVTAEEMIGIIRNSKITLNVHVVEQVYSEGTNVRTFEAAGAGGFLLVNKRKSLYELFNVGREIEVFDSCEELVEKTKFYLKKDLLREKIAKAGWERTRKDHTYHKRFSLLLKKIEPII